MSGPPREPDPAHEADPSWACYPQTVLDFEGTVGPVDLRRPLEPATTERLRMLLGGAFAVVTPCNPRGHAVTEPENLDRAARFEAELHAAGLRWTPCTGRSPDGVHAEPGAAIAEPMAAVIERASRWGQSALFWFDGDRFWLVPALVSGDPIALPGPPARPG